MGTILQNFLETFTYAELPVSNDTDRSRSSTCSIVDCPFDVLNIIFELISSTDLFRIGITCTKLHQNVKRSTAWKYRMWKVRMCCVENRWRVAHLFHAPNVELPKPRMCHLSVVFQNYMYVIGGDSPRPNETQNFGELLGIDDVHRFDFEHSGAVVGTSLYMFGGVSLNNSRANRMWRFDLVTHAIQSLECSGKVPPNGSYYACVHYQNCLYVAGGWDPRNPVTHFQVYCLDLATCHWSEVLINGPSAPNFRRAHRGFLYKDYFYVFGGFDNFNYIHKLIRLNLKTFCWSSVRTTGNKPSGRSRFGAVLHENKFYVHGGWRDKPLEDFFVLDLDTLRWSQIYTDCNTPVSQHSLVCWNNSLFIFGGNNGQQVNNNMYGHFLGK